MLRRVLLAFVGLLAGLVAQSPSPAAPVAPKQESLFDGRTLRGWDGDPKVWSVVDGMLRGSTVDHPIEHNTFLIWTGGELRDFELSYRIKLDGSNNSGMQYRSWRLTPDGFGVAGYQCDFHDQPDYFGMLYEEGGRGVTVRRGERAVSDVETGKVSITGKLGEVTKADLAQWHTFRVIARGSRVQHEVDGVLALDFDDRYRKVARQGLLAIQVHAGPAMTVWCKDIELVRLPTEEIATPPPAPPAPPRAEPPAQWLWLPVGAKDQEGFFRCEFDLDAVPKEAQLAASGDNHIRVTLNGNKVLQGNDWTAPVGTYVQKALVQGRNVLAAYVSNDDGPAAFALRLDWGDAAGVRHAVVSDGSWRCATDDPDGWDRAGFAGAGWAPPQVFGAVGQPGLTWSPTVGATALDPAAFVAEPQRVLPAPELRVPEGFVAERVYTVPKSFGSWSSLTNDDQGRFYGSDQYHGLYRVTVAREGGPAMSTCERVPVEIDGAQGLCWANGALYLMANGVHSGLYRLRDTDQDDVLDKVELLRELPGSAGEHGPHAIVLDRDGKHLLVVCGNHTPLPQFAESRLPRNWQEDLVLPRMDDPGGHAVGVMAPGGFVARTDFDGKNWELIGAGLRNAYDVAVGPLGELFTFDADMEWDMGTPWYRPTRICHMVSGAEFGWRNGSGKWPADYPDSLPPVIDIGPASPTGLKFGGATGFPDKYESALYACDWTYGTIYAIHLEPRGVSFGATKEDFVVGVPLAVTDIATGQGGGIYFITGGRGTQSVLYRVRWRDKIDHGFGARLPVGTPHDDEILRRHAIEKYHGRVDALAVDTCWPLLSHDDVFLRYAARIAIESQPVAEWRARVFAEKNAWSSLTALLALVHQGGKDDLAPVLDTLGRFNFAILDQARRIAWLRVHELAVIRLGPLTDDQRLSLGTRLLALFPCGDDRVDRELCALLCRLDAPGIVDKAMPLLTANRPTPVPSWMELTTRNASYGGVIQKMLADMPPSSGIGYANALRTVRHGFTLDQRRALLQFLAAAMQKPGGASYRGYLSHMFDDVVAQLTVAETAELATLIGKKPPVRELFRSTPPKGPGRAWSLDEATAIAKVGLHDRSFAAGRNLFHAVSCAACHHFAGEGGSGGPDLTSVGNKFGARDALEAMIDPSKAVSDQFAGAILKKKDGTSLFGRVVLVGTGAEAAYEVLPAVADPKPVRVLASDVASVEPSKQSPMPQNLLDRLSQDELLDLLAFVLSRGDEQAAMFRR